MDFRPSIEKLELLLVRIVVVIVRFDGRNGKCTLVNARAVTDFARVGGKIMQMFEGRYESPLEVGPRIDDRSNLDGRLSININVSNVEVANMALFRTNSK